jgi:hypothetical protein
MVYACYLASANSKAAFFLRHKEVYCGNSSVVVIAESIQRFASSENPSDFIYRNDWQR